MESKNGAPELISMLSYMKDTRLNNPDILVKDKRNKDSEDYQGEDDDEKVVILKYYFK